MNQQTTTPAAKGSFAWLNITQFLGALNDNLFKLFIVFFLIGTFGDDAASRVTATAGAVFVAPFLLLSPLAGRLADRLSKRTVIVATKIAEIVIMGVGVVSFWLQSEPGLYLTLLLMASQSALFSPAKFGIIPELVRSEQLSRANALLEACTYLAIILGTALASLLPGLVGSYSIAVIGCLALAIVGLATSLPIHKTPVAASPHDSGAPLHAFTDIRRDRQLLLAVLGAGWFMLLGAFFQLNLIPYGIQTLGLTQEQSGALFLVAALGIGIGSLAAGRLSGPNVEFGVVPLGSLGLTLSATLLGLNTGELWSSLATVLAMGISAGLFIVPLQAFIQQRAPRQRLGAILATSNLIGWIGVLLASALIYLFSEFFGLSARHGFLIIGLSTLALTLTAFRVLPDFLLRFLASVPIRACYRLRVTGREHLPTQGGALLVANHVSWVDALLLLATGQRRIRFIMERGIFNTRLLRPLFRLMGVIPISAQDSRRHLVASLKQARQALDQGYLVCIFAEGAITRNGTLGPFRPGLEKIVAGSGHPIIPIYLSGAWGSIFSYSHGRLLARLPKQIPYPVGIHFGQPLPDHTPAAEVRQAIAELSSEFFMTPRKAGQSLAVAFVKSARRHWRKPAIADTTGRRMNYGQTLTAALLLSDQLATRCREQQHLGILLPPSTAGALANIGITLTGKVPVNLNYTRSEELV